MLPRQRHVVALPHDGAEFQREIGYPGELEQVRAACDDREMHRLGDGAESEYAQAQWRAHLAPMMSLPCGASTDLMLSPRCMALNASVQSSIG